MNMSEIKRAARAYLDDKDVSLQCMDFKGAVKVNHQDGSVFLFENAIMEEKQYVSFKLLLVWTEHCDSFFFFTDDLESWYYIPYEISQTQERPESSGSPDQCTDDH